MSLLDIDRLSVHYGHALVINELNIEVRHKECVGVIGPNGAGKTTLLRSISGVKDWDGTMTFDGYDL
ncbi:MAG: ATP-binding cassette domain-containing protein, partial [Desulfobacterales bacterium]|nr:ATP-binding cassette domain-containing protein [Desulfobacterales bacterium]